MKVHHLNCGTMRPYGGRLISGTGSVFAAATMVCHCLLIETEAGLVLVDSGLGTGDVRDPDATLDRNWRRLCRPVLDESETALRQIERLGYAASDVRHVVLTHLDLDHAGGLRDFPAAKVHVLADELAAAESARTAAERRRYPRAQWAHGPDWVTHQPDGEDWFGFQAVRDIAGLPADILLVPLVGHNPGSHRCRGPDRRGGCCTPVTRSSSTARPRPRRTARRRCASCSARSRPCVSCVSRTRTGCASWSGTTATPST